VPARYIFVKMNEGEETTMLLFLTIEKRIGTRKGLAFRHANKREEERPSNNKEKNEVPRTGSSQVSQQYEVEIIDEKEKNIKWKMKKKKKRMGER